MKASRTHHSTDQGMITLSFSLDGPKQKMITLSFSLNGPKQQIIRCNWAMSLSANANSTQMERTTGPAKRTGVAGRSLAWQVAHCFPRCSLHHQVFLLSYLYLTMVCGLATVHPSASQGGKRQASLQ